METKMPTPIGIALPVSGNEEPSPPAPPLRGANIGFADVPVRGRGEQERPLASGLPLSHGRGDRGTPWWDGREKGSGGEGLPEEADGPRFIPLAVAIDLGMTPPIGTIRTTPVDVAPLETPEPPQPARRHLRLLPSPGA